jgi:predicted nucleic acid-binding protein
MKASGDYYFDSSAAMKHYHQEGGTVLVDSWLTSRESRHFISLLTVVEIHSGFAKKVREGVITQVDFSLLCRRFYHDRVSRLFQVLPMSAKHYYDAEGLIRRYALGTKLRTLDALQLAVAIDFRPDHFVSCDDTQLKVAEIEGLTVLDPNP